tara:strand:- start:4134 stop:6428 length:2295 start_codon:yes stop_codon:yes gene_type:complete
MAVNLYQGADPTIATAAARAGMALAPADYSTTFQNIATSYAEGMEKLGTGLAKAAEVGATATAHLVQDAKLAKETYGQNWMDTVYGDMKGLIRGGIDILKGQVTEIAEDGTKTVTKLVDESEAGGLSIADQKAQMKQNWKTKKTRAFNTFKKMRDGTLGIEELLNNGNVNLNALSAADSLVAQGLMAKGDAIKGGPFDGCRVEMEVDETGEGYVFKVYDKNGKAVSGVHAETGNLEYVDGTDIIPIKREQRTENAKVNNATVNKYLEADVSSLKNNLQRGELIYDQKQGNAWSAAELQNPNLVNQQTRDTYEIQSFLESRGYDIGATGADGIWGSKTQAAWDKFKQESGPAPVGTNDLLGALATAADRSQLSITADQVDNLVVTHEADKIIALNKIDIDNINNGAKGLQFRENEVRNQIRGIVDTPNAFRDLTHSNLANMQYTYAEQLGMPNQWSAAMLTQVQRMGEDGLLRDTNNDGSFDAGDFQETDYENFKVLRNEMLNPHNQAAKEIFVNWFTNGVKLSHQGGLDRFNAKNTGGGGGGGGGGEEDKFRYPATQNYQGGVTGSVLNNYLAMLQGGSLTLEGERWNLNEAINVWQNDLGETMTGGDLVQRMQDDIYTNFGEDAYNILLDENFAPYAKDMSSAPTPAAGGPIVVKDNYGAEYELGLLSNWSRTGGKDGNFVYNGPDIMRGGELLLPKGAMITATKGSYKHDGKIVTEDTDAVWDSGEKVMPQSGWTSSYIGPGLTQRLVDVLIRNEGSDGELD